MLGKTSGTDIIKQIKLLFNIVLLLLAMKFILILSFNFVQSKLFKFQRSGHRTYWLIVVFLPFSFKGHTDKQNRLLC